MNIDQTAPLSSDPTGVSIEEAAQMVDSQSREKQIDPEKLREIREYLQREEHLGLGGVLGAFVGRGFEFSSAPMIQSDVRAKVSNGERLTRGEVLLHERCRVVNLCAIQDEGRDAANRLRKEGKLKEAEVPDLQSRLFIGALKEFDGIDGDPRSLAQRALSRCTANLDDSIEVVIHPVNYEKLMGSEWVVGIGQRLPEDVNTLRGWALTVGALSIESASVTQTAAAPTLVGGGETGISR